MIYRHGDVNLIQSELPEGVKEEFTGNSMVIALGEQTGHNHTLVAERPFTAYQKEGVRYLRFDFPTKIQHQEHKELTITPGTYRQDQERETDWFSQTVRKVID